MSRRLGAVLVGIGILILLIYIKNNGKVEGFQTASPNIDLQTISIKDNELRTKFAIIQNNKSIKDTSLVTVLSNDSFNALHILYNEVSDYVNNTNIIKLYSSANASQISNLYQMMYTIAYMTDILYTIYVTLPSVAVASNTIIDSNTANFNSINDINITNETASLINTVLSSVPSPSKLIIMYHTTVSQNILNLKTNASGDQIKITNSSLTQYTKMIDLQLKIFQDKITTLTSLKSDPILVNTYNDTILFITETIYKLNDYNNQLNTIEPSDIPVNVSSIKDTINRNITKYTTMQNDLIQKLKILQPESGSKVEGFKLAETETFQSSSNPYSLDIKPTYDIRLDRISKSINDRNEPFQSTSNPYTSDSPSLTQAQNFRLAKISTVPIINEPFQSSSNPYTSSVDLIQAQKFTLEKNRLIQKVTKSL